MMVFSAQYNEYQRLYMYMYAESSLVPRPVTFWGVYESHHTVRNGMGPGMRCGYAERVWPPAFSLLKKTKQKKQANKKKQESVGERTQTSH